eukprot:SM000057S18413  [mRNA]  locus=s57:437159:441728:- [translate_table: standard]
MSPPSMGPARAPRQVHRARQMYECVTPVAVAFDVEAPDHVVRKFTQDGQYLIAFSRSQQDLLVYRYKGLSFGYRGDDPVQHFSGAGGGGGDGLPPEARTFEGYFVQVYSRPMASVHSGELLCKDFLLTTDSGNFGILALSTAPEPDPSPAPGALPGLPAMDSITFLLVRLADGEIMDRRTFRGDYIHLAQNAGVFLYDDLLAILSIRFQQIHILQVRDPGGLFVDVRTIGTHCHEDDELVLMSEVQKEARFGAEQAAAKLWPPGGRGKLVKESLYRHHQAALTHHNAVGASTAVPPPFWLHPQRASVAAGADHPNGAQMNGDVARGSLAQQRPTRALRPRHTFATYEVAYGDGGTRAHRRQPGHRAASLSGRDRSGGGGADSRSLYTASSGDSERSGGSGSQRRRAGSDRYVNSRQEDSRDIDQQQFGGSADRSSASEEEEVSGRARAVVAATAASRPRASDTARQQQPLLRPRDHHQAAGPGFGPAPSDSGGRAPDVAEGGWGGTLANSTAAPNEGRGGAASTSGSPALPLPAVRARQGGSSFGGLHLGPRLGPGAATANGLSPHQRTASLNDIQSLEGAAAGRRAGADGRGGQDEDGSGGAANAAATADGASRRGAGGRDGQTFVTGIKQRLLSYIFRGIWEQDSDPLMRSQRLKRFYYHFQHYSDLAMWKVQFLDRYHLLIKFGSADGVVLRSSNTSHQNAFFAVYNLDTTQMLGFYQNSSEELLTVFERFCDHFRASPSYPLVLSYITSYSNNPYAREHLHKQRAASFTNKSGSLSQIVKRTLASLPFSAQSHSPSPYFDQSMFQFDEKLISSMDKHRPCMEHPIKFISRRRPNVLLFKIQPGLEGGVQDARMKRVAAYFFHPTLPFAISVQQCFMQPLVVNFHFRF